MMMIAKRGLIFLALWLVLLAAIAAVGEQVAPIYEPMKIRRALLRERASEIHALSIGSSHAQALDFSQLGVTGFHFWQDGGDLHESTFLAREVMPQLPALQCIFVSFSPYSIHGDNGAPTRVSRAQQRREIYARTMSREHLEGDGRLFLTGKLAPLLRDDHWKPVVLWLAGRKQAEPMTKDGAPIRARFNQSMREDSLERAGTLAASQMESIIVEVVRVRPSAKGAGLRAVEDLLNLAAATGHYVVLYSTPLHESFLRAIPALRLEEMRSAAQDLSMRHRNVVYVDYSNAEPFASRPDLFADSNHLNARGARVFSRMLADQLHAGPAAPCVR
jgi:hypothetical protein